MFVLSDCKEKNEIILYILYKCTALVKYKKYQLCKVNVKIQL